MINASEVHDGLSSQEAKARLQQYGQNEIYKPYIVTFLDIAWEEVREPMILLLLVTGVLYSIFGNIGDALTIFVVIILLVFAEVYTEYRAKKAISALQEIAAVKSKVKRDGHVVEINTLDLVPGDVVILTQGTKISADAKIEQGIGLSVDESALTGESLPVEKSNGNDIYAGTIVVNGEGQALVTVTGEGTRIGKVAELTKSIKPPRTTLQLAMRSLAGQLVYVAVFFSVAIPLLGFLRGQDWKIMIMTGLALSFAVIPEELPIVITMVLGLGSYNLTKHNFLVKRLKSTENLGNTTVIVTDKTGTITEGKMRIASVYPGSQNDVLRTASLCISEYTRTPLDLEILEKSKQDGTIQTFPEIVRQRNIGDGHKTKSVIRKNSDGFALYMSGAPEEIFSSCHEITPEVKDELAKQTHAGRRVIGVAWKKIASDNVNQDFESLEKGMNFVGLISFEDSPRQGVKETIAKAAKAGIRTIMVTGDHPATAGSIAEQVGIVSARVITGDELDHITDDELKKVLNEVSVFARSTPEHKYRIVKALQENHEVVAVTGDGFNDVLALKGADIGIAMGKKGTDVAREASDIVLADDNFNTITQGIFEGRGLFDNLYKGIKYYLCIKLALILIFLVPVILNVPMPFAPIQIILLELFMDLAASAGFVAEPKEKNIFTRKPRDPKVGIFNRGAIIDILIKSIFLFAAVTAVYLYIYYQTSNMVEAQTYAFSAWIIGHIVLAYVSRSEKESIISVGLFANKVMNLWALAAIAVLCIGIYVPMINSLVRLTSIPLLNLLSVMVLVTIIILVLELKKLLFNKP